MGNLFIGKQKETKEQSIIAFCSFDRRRTDDGKRWSADYPFGNRAYFQENPYISNLIIKDVRKEVCVLFV